MLQYAFKLLLWFYEMYYLLEASLYCVFNSKIIIIIHFCIFVSEILFDKAPEIV